MTRYEVQARCADCNEDHYFYATVRYDESIKKRKIYARRCDKCNGKWFIIYYVDDVD